MCWRKVGAYGRRLQQAAPMPEEMLGHSQITEGFGSFFTPPKNYPRHPKERGKNKECEPARLATYHNVQI